MMCTVGTIKVDVAYKIINNFNWNLKKKKSPYQPKKKKSHVNIRILKKEKKLISQILKKKN